MCSPQIQIPAGASRLAGDHRQRYTGEPRGFDVCRSKDRGPRNPRTPEPRGPGALGDETWNLQQPQKSRSLGSSMKPKRLKSVIWFIFSFFSIWGFPQMGVPRYPKMDGLGIKKDDLRVPLFQEASIHVVFICLGVEHIMARGHLHPT